MKSNKPVRLIVFYHGVGAAPGFTRESVHKTASAAYEKLADVIRRCDDYSHYKIEWLVPRGS